MARVIMWLLLFGALLAVSCRDGGEFLPVDCWDDNSYPVETDIHGRTDEGTPSYDEGVPVCIPQCDGKVCGPDGCGGSCGDCVEGTWCDEGTCVPFDVCTPNCVSRVCGPDGCGGTCGDCDNGTTCNSAGHCVNPSSEGTGDCSDRIDNDLDGNTDCDDLGCKDAEACQEVETTYNLTCRFTGYVINMTDPGTKLTCPRVWAFEVDDLDVYGRLPIFARNTGGSDGTLEATTKSLSMKDIPWTLGSDPTPSSVFAVVGGETIGICDHQSPLTKSVIVPAGRGQAVTANCGAN